VSRRKKLRPRKTAMLDMSLRASILGAVKSAQSNSRARAKGSNELLWHSEDHMRLRSFIAHLADDVSNQDVALASALKAFIEAWPGDEVKALSDITE